MKYQLRRKVLIDMGTDMHMLSGCVTAIDPRGGAAAFGDNGVGQTTTRRAPCHQHPASALGRCTEQTIR